MISLDLKVISQYLIPDPEVFLSLGHFKDGEYSFVRLEPF